MKVPTAHNLKKNLILSVGLLAVFSSILLSFGWQGPFLALADKLSLQAPPTSTATTREAGLLLRKKNKTVPNLSFQNAKGEKTDLSQHKGKLILLNFWSTGCAPCRREMPTLAKMQEKFKKNAFEIITVNIDHFSPQEALAFLSNSQADGLTNYFDPSQRTFFKFNFPGLPASLLISPTGQELGRLLGEARWDSPEMIALIERLLKQKGTSNQK